MWKAIIGVDNSSDIAEGEKLRGVVSIYQGIRSLRIKLTSEAILVTIKVQAIFWFPRKTMKRTDGSVPQPDESFDLSVE